MSEGSADYGPETTALSSPSLKGVRELKQGELGGLRRWAVAADELIECRGVGHVVWVQGDCAEPDQMLEGTLMSCSPAGSGHEEGLSHPQGRYARVPRAAVVAGIKRDYSLAGGRDGGVADQCVLLLPATARGELPDNAPFLTEEVRVPDAVPTKVLKAHGWHHCGGACTDSSLVRGRINASGPAARFLKSRGTTIGSNAIVNDNDTVGLLIFQPDDGADFDTAAARIAAEVDDANPLAGDIGMAFIWEQMPGDATALRETMRLDAAGDLTLATGGSVISDTIQTTTVTISNAELKALNATPIQVVAAPGANRVIVVDEIIFFNNNGGTDFAESNTDEAIVVDYDNSGFDVITAFDSTIFITATADFIVSHKGLALAGADPATNYVNEKLQVRVTGTGEFITGDGTMNVTVIYHILATP